MTLYLIFMVISVVMSFLNIFLRILGGYVIGAVLVALFWALFILYCMICLMNLKQKFQEICWNSAAVGEIVHARY